MTTLSLFGIEQEIFLTLRDATEDQNLGLTLGGISLLTNQPFHDLETSLVYLKNMGVVEIVPNQERILDKTLLRWRLCSQLRDRRP